MAKTFKVALALREAVFAGREFFLGACAFANTRSDWNIQRVEDTTFLTWDQALSVEPDGIIGVLDGNTPIRRTQTGNSRVVIVNGSVQHHPFHKVISDGLEAGRRVAAHLLDLRLTQFAYVGIAKVHFSQMRHDGFTEALRRAGIGNTIPATDFDVAHNPPTNFRNWLLTLPLPCGVLCANDGIAEKVIRIARDARLDVPQDLAVASISNDEISCVESVVTLSSLDQDFREVGRRAAAHLQGWMTGRRPLRKCEYVPPGEMVERDSTRMSGATDPLVRRALAIIQREFRDELTVEGLLERLGKLSRRQLELRFRETLNSSPHEEILRHRFREAQRLIRSTRLSFEEIAYQTGFYDPAHFCRQFKKLAGTTPSEYRKIHTNNLGCAR